MTWFKNRKISTKLIISFLVVAFIAIIIGGVGVINIIDMEKAATQLYEKNAMSLKHSGAGSSKFQQVRYHTINLATLLESGIAEEKLNLEAVVSEYEEILVELDRLIDADEAKVYLNDIHTYWEEYKKVMETIIFHIDNGNSKLALLVIRETLTPIGANEVDSFQALMDVVSTNADLRAQNNTRSAFSSIAIMASVAMLGLGVSIILGLYIARLIGRPLKKMAEAADKLAIGDVDIEMTAGANDEVGKLIATFTKVVEGRKRLVEETRRLANGDLTVDIQIDSDKDVLGISLSSLVESFNELVLSIISSGEQVASSSNLVSNTSIALSQGAAVQASAILMLTASLEEVSSQTTLSAKNAQLVNEIVRHAKSNAEDGNDQMKNMIHAMDILNTASLSINKIIKVIDDIAFQTKILALNAAVEAARAGQYGKGFAVVAEEVRTLAAKSAEAAQNTSVLIDDIIKKIKSSSKIVESTDIALHKIVEDIADAASYVEDIASSSSDQALAIQEISQGIQQVSLVVHNSAATAEESAAASEQLASQAERLRETIGVFKVNEKYAKEVCFK